MGVKVEGLEMVLDRLDEVADVEQFEQAMKKACALVEREAKKKAPKDTGALRRSITSKVQKVNGAVQGVIFTPLEYAPYVEYGTGLFAEKGGRNDAWSYQDDEGNWHRTNGQHPQPFLHPAFNESRTEILRILKEGGLNND